MTPLQPGDKAPDFSGMNEKGRLFSLSDFKGRKFVLYFYPEDDTPTCTNQACGFRDEFSTFKKKKVPIVGVSPDTVDKHKKFISKYQLPFTLLADPDLKILQAYGVWGPKKFMGRDIISVHRTTFIIDENGVIEKIFTNIRTKNHTQNVLDAL